MKTLWAWVWELPQMLIGTVIYVVLLPFTKPLFKYNGTRVRQFKKLNVGSLSIGRYIFISYGYRFSKNETFYKILEHEYGHIIQSRLVGPWFLIAIGLPSILRAMWFQVFNGRQSDYMRAVFEHTATELGFYSGIRSHVRVLLDRKEPDL